MPDKPPMEDSRRMWERVLSSIPHGVKVRTISVRGTEAKRQAEPPEPMEPSPEPTPPSRFGQE
jgi:hypothetical protein